MSMSDYRSGPGRPYDGRDGRGREGTGPAGEQARMTRAEMRRAAQAAGRRAGRRKAGAGRRHAGVRDGRSAPPGAKRFINYPRADRRGLRRWIPSWRQLLGIFVMSFGTLTAGVGYAYATTQIPDINPSTQLQDNIFYWSDGSVMASVGQVNRQNVQLADVPAKVQWDFLAAENASFYTDPGIDPQGILRAVYHMASGGAVQSGSTITQQFVKNSYLNQSQTVTRKLREIMISLKIGTKMSKQEILQGYLNSSYYGRGAYGIEAAAEAYYHVPAKDLNVSQGAFLAATVNEPSVLMNADSDPQAKQAATARWRYVLDRMVVIHQISAAQEQQYIAAGFPTPVAMSTNGAMTGQVGYLVQTAGDYVKTHLNINDQQFNNGGYQIHTTFDKNKVNELAASVDKMTKQHLDPKHRSADRNVQAGAASVDPTSGRIVALYGGPGFDKQHFTNNADTKGVPVGSTFKPFDLAAALDHGAVLSPGQPPSPITPASKFNGDNGIKIKDQQGNSIQDSNDPTGFLHQQNDTSTQWGYISLRKAMEQSINTPYVQLGEYVGYSDVENEALKAGLLRSSLQYDTAGFYIGTSSPSAIRMADAYGTFANSGIHHEPYSVTKVLKDGIQQPGFAAPTGSQAVPSKTAAAVTDVLRSVVKSGTGTNAQALGRPVAGKTGTTDNYKSAWFVGYTPQLSTSVVMFKEDPKKAGLQSMVGVGGMAKVFGADMPTEVWTGYMTAALKGTPVKNFPPAPQLGEGTSENGAPSPSPSAPSSAPASPTVTPSQSASSSPSVTSCSQLGCTSPTPSPTDTSSTGGGTGGSFGGPPGGGSTPTPTPTPKKPGGAPSTG
ncbi:transglycosylase domain-containing protein [Streptomyces sp. NPDC002619]|uniref:transglycosylase domain-containing protein n=1 Tax=Streptomyces sp. NPDC002619 TaxID=3364655 RepID=UPI0036C462F8